jgi:hypothetical protein
MAAVGQRRPHPPDHLHNSQALVKRQRTNDQQLIIGSVTKDVSSRVSVVCILPVARK